MSILNEAYFNEYLPEESSFRNTYCDTNSGKTVLHRNALERDYYVAARISIHCLTHYSYDDTLF